MDRPLSEAEWMALLAKIQSHSVELEREMFRSSENLIEALSGTRSLEDLTRAHLASPEPLPPVAAPSPQASVTQTSRPSSPPAPPQPEIQYRTSRREYAPALDQSELVQALLALQKRRTHRTASARAGKTSAASAQADPRFSAQFSPQFSPMRIPEVQAEPKSAPIAERRLPGVRIPVLRSNPGRGDPEGRNGNS